MIGGLLIILGMIGGIAWATWRLYGDIRCLDPVATESDRARARVLLHAAARERQLGQLEGEMERQAHSQLWHWEQGNWDGWS